MQSKYMLDVMASKPSSNAILQWKELILRIQDTIRLLGVALAKLTLLPDHWNSEQRREHIACQRQLPHKCVHDLLFLESQHGETVAMAISLWRSPHHPLSEVSAPSALLHLREGKIYKTSVRIITIGEITINYWILQRPVAAYVKHSPTSPRILIIVTTLWNWWQMID